MDNKTMNLNTVHIDKLINYNLNARTHDKKQLTELSASIKRFGFNDPVEVDENFVILSGHARVEAAKKLGITEIPVVQHLHLTEDEKKAYILAANKIQTKAGWDEMLLKIEMNYLNEVGFDLSLTGFDEKEINNLLKLDVNKGFCDEDECPELPEETITKQGDIWILGNHRLVCGDATVQTDVEKLFFGQIPNLMITDPPYGVSYESNWRAEAKNVDKSEREKVSHINNDNRADWYDAYVLFPGSTAYVWHASRFSDVVMDGLKRSGFEVKQQIIWNKNVHALSRSDYHWKHEPCWYAVKKGAQRAWYGDRTQMTVWDIKNILNEKKDKTKHPTQKPVEIYTKPIELHTNQNEYVYDPFAGSGSLVIACEKLHRRALCIEIDPKFCDVIVKRWQKFSNKKAILESTGEEFNG